MKKLLTILLATALILTSSTSFVCAAGKPTFGFGTADVSDTTVSIPVYVSEMPEKLACLSAVTFKYSYDKDYLSYETTNDGTLTGLINSDGEAVFADDGAVLWIDTDDSHSLYADDLGKNKPLFTVVFSVKQVPESKIWVKISYTKLSDKNQSIATSPADYDVLPAWLNLTVDSDEPGADEPGTDNPGTDEPGTDEPGTDNPGTDEPGTDNPGTDNPGTDEPGTDNPGTDNPGTDEPGTDEPGTDNPGTDEPGTDEPGTDNPGTDNPGSDDTGSGDTGSDDNGSGDAGSGGNDSGNTGTNNKPSTGSKPSSGGGSGGNPSGGGAPIVIAPAPTPVKATKASQAFADVDDSHWAAESALILYNKGIVSGDASGKANFDNKITREETAKLALLVNGFEVNSSTLNAKDASSVSPWAVTYMATAVDRGIFSGYEDGSVKPRANITRQEMVTVIIKALGLEIDANANVAFADKDSITWATPYIAKAVELGFVSGYEDGTFKPTKDITRAEAFKIFAKVLEYKGL